MRLNNKPVVPAGAFLRRYSNTSNLFKILAILAKRRKALWSSAVGFLKKPLSSCREFANCCIKASALLDDVKIGSTMNQKRKEKQFYDYRVINHDTDIRLSEKSDGCS